MVKTKNKGDRGLLESRSKQSANSFGELQSLAQPTPRAPSQAGSARQDTPPKALLSSPPPKCGLSTGPKQQYEDQSVDGQGIQFVRRHAGGGLLPPRAPACRPPTVKPLPARFGIGVESEFVVSRRDGSATLENVGLFGRLVAEKHNQEVPAVYPRMVSDLDEQAKSTRANEQPRQTQCVSSLETWVLVHDSSICRAQEPYGIELRSPLFVGFPGSTWRSKVSRTWAHLERQYFMHDEKACSTHIHISIAGGFDLDDLKRIAKCAFYFEPALDALVPAHRRGDFNHHAFNIWLGPMDYNARPQTNRLELLGYIDQAETIDELVSQVNRFGRAQSWNFLSIWKFYTVEFRKPPPCTTGAEVLSWADLTLAFVQTAVQYGTLDVLKNLPFTVGGLRSFLRKGHVPDLTKPENYNKLFTNVSPDAAVIVVPNMKQAVNLIHDTSLNQILRNQAVAIEFNPFDLVSTTEAMKRVSRFQPLVRLRRPGRGPAQQSQPEATSKRAVCHPKQSLHKTKQSRPIHETNASRSTPSLPLPYTDKELNKLTDFLADSHLISKTILGEGRPRQSKDPRCFVHMDDFRMEVQRPES